MNSLSLKLKLLVSTASMLFVTQIVSTLLNTISMTEASEYVRQLTKDIVLRSAQTQVQLKSEAAAERIEAYLNQSFVVPLSLSEMLKNTSVHVNGAPLSREEVKQLNHDMLRANPNISAIYSQMEMNGYDGLDSQYVDDSDHSTPSGTLELYWVREEGKLVFYSVEDAQEKYLSDMDEFGQREAEWYLCSRDTGKPCIIEPYWETMAA